jgi:hypothetical protein
MIQTKTTLQAKTWFCCATGMGACFSVPILPSKHARFRGLRANKLALIQELDANLEKQVERSTSTGAVSALSVLVSPSRDCDFTNFWIALTEVALLDLASTEPGAVAATALAAAPAASTGVSAAAASCFKASVLQVISLTHCFLCFNPRALNTYLPLVCSEHVVNVNIEFDWTLLSSTLRGFRKSLPFSSDIFSELTLSFCSSAFSLYVK